MASKTRRQASTRKNTWDYVKEAWESLVDCPTKIEYDDCLTKFEIACSTWSMFVDYVKHTWLVPHRQRFVTMWTNKVIHLGTLQLTGMKVVNLYSFFLREHINK